MNTRLRHLPTWIRFSGLMGAIALAWWAAIVILPGDGWQRPGRLTALGLAVVLVFVVLALVAHRRDWKKMERDRLERRRRRHP